MRSTFRVYREFFTSSFRRELEFRANFIAQGIQNMVWVVFFLLILRVIYGNADSVGGWNEGAAYVLSATCLMMGSVAYSVFGYNLIDFGEKVRKGSLDFDLLKPVDSQFLISFRRVAFGELGALIAGSILLVYGLVHSGAAISIAGMAAYFLLLGCALVLFYCLNLMMMTTAVWFVKVENLWVLGETALSMVRYPLEIFSPTLRLVFLYALPLAFLSWAPSKALLGSMPSWYCLLGVCWTVVALAVSRWFYIFALKYYGSASS